MNSNLKTLVKKLIDDGTLRTQSIIDAFNAVDRKNFVRAEYEDDPYGDYPLPIGHGQTISQPTTVAIMLELLGSKKDEVILDVGSGSGWTTALLAHIVGKNGRVYGIETIPGLVAFGNENLSKFEFSQAEINEAVNEIGLKERAPYDKILVSAAAEELPHELVTQLKIDGTMVIPIKNAVLRVTRTSETENEIERFEGFRFVPLK